MTYAKGRVIGGRYTIDSQLGTSVRATTYSAVNMLSRDVAVKVLHVPEAERASTLQAITKQNEALGRIPDRVLLRPIDAGMDNEGQLYVVSPLTTLPSLAQVVASCPLTPEEAIHSMWRVARALDVVHEAGLAHLALKPTNVFIGPGPDYTVQLADFSSDLVRRLVGDMDNSGLWLAPEQLSDPISASRAQAPADIYAAARLMFFALTGKTLPEGRRPVEYSIEIGRAIPVALDEPMLMGLERSPAGRYESATKLVEALGPASVPSLDLLDSKTSLPPVDVPPPPAAVLAPLIAFEQKALSELAPPAPRRSSTPSEPELFSLPKTQPKMAVSGMPPPPTSDQIAELRGDTSSTNPLLAGSGPSRTADLVPPPSPPFWERVSKIHLAIGAGAFAAMVLVVLVIVILNGRKASAVATKEVHVPSASIALATPPPPAIPDTKVEAPPPASVAVATPPPAEPAPTPSAPPSSVPAEPAEPSPADGPPLGANEAQLDVTCDPKCDYVMIDGKASTYPAPVRLSPGIHAVNPVKVGHIGKWEKVNVKAGETKSVALVLFPTPPPGKKPAVGAAKR